MASHRVVVLTFPRVPSFELGIACEVFATERPELRTAWWYSLEVCTEHPGALPALWSGARVGASVAVIGAVFGELVGSSRGLGYLMTRSTATFQTDRVFGVIVALAIVAMGLYGLVAMAERLTTPWRRRGD